MAANWATRLKQMTKEERRKYGQKKGLTDRDINMYEKRRERRASGKKQGKGGSR